MKKTYAATNDGKAIVENIMTRTSIRQYTDQANFCRHGKEKRFRFISMDSPFFCLIACLET